MQSYILSYIKAFGLSFVVICKKPLASLMIVTTLSAILVVPGSAFLFWKSASYIMHNISIDNNQAIAELNESSGLGSLSSEMQDLLPQSSGGYVPMFGRQTVGIGFDVSKIFNLQNQNFLQELNINSVLNLVGVTNGVNSVFSGVGDAASGALSLLSNIVNSSTIAAIKAKVGVHILYVHQLYFLLDLALRILFGLLFINGINALLLFASGVKILPEIAKTELQVMHNVCAGSHCKFKPFWCSGFWFGLISGGCALLLVRLLLFWLQHPVSKLFFAPENTLLLGFDGFEGVMMLCLGCILGLFLVWLALGKWVCKK